MAFCSNCGNAIPLDAKFCSNCGVRVTSFESNNYVGQAERYLELAFEAMDAKNWYEGNRYASMALELEPKKARAWMVKMFAAENLEESYDKLRTSEVIHYGNNAIKYAPADRIEYNADIVYSCFLQNANHLIQKAIDFILKVDRKNGQYVLCEAFDLAISLKDDALKYRYAISKRYIRTDPKKAELFLSRYVLFIAIFGEIFKNNGDPLSKTSVKNIIDNVENLGDFLSRDALSKYNKVIKKTIGTPLPSIKYITRIMEELLY